MKTDNGSSAETIWCRDHTGQTYSFDDFFRKVEAFHGFPAPGLLLGGRMVALAMDRLPPDTLFDAITETASCLPDAVQMLTLCTVGNGWLKVWDLGRYAVTLYDKYQGNGIRVAIDPVRLADWSEYYVWLYKQKEKKEQDYQRLIDEIRQAGDTVMKVTAVQVQPQHRIKQSKGEIATCALCGEPYPLAHGGICRGCQGRTPYVNDGAALRNPEGSDAPDLERISAAEAVGEQALHDMTQIIPGEEKGPAFKRGQTITAGDVCRLHQMGRFHLYTAKDGKAPEGWVHEDDAALAFAQAMAGDGVVYKTPPREGKINFTAGRDGLLTVDVERLTAFNTIPGVMCATRKRYQVLHRGDAFAGTRAIPLYLNESDFYTALSVLENGPLLNVLPLRSAKVGILVTGTEVFRGLVKDRFIPIVRAKVEKFGCSVVASDIVPDDREQIREGIDAMRRAGADLIVTTAGLSVDPDDVTRQGLIAAGCTDIRYGAPVLPGAMTLLAAIGDVQVIGIPACGLYHDTTSFDLLLPRLLAGVPVTRRDLAALGHGSFCLSCSPCTFPRCSFGQ